MSDLDGLGPISLDPETLRATPKATLSEMLEGAIIARVVDFEDVSPYLGAQLGMILSNSLRPIWWPVAVPNDVDSPARFMFFNTLFDLLNLQTPAMIRKMTRERPLGESPASPIFRRIEGDRILHVHARKGVVVLNEWGGERQTLEMASGATVYIDAVGPSIGWPDEGVAANYGITWKPGPRRTLFFMSEGRRGPKAKGPRG